jgi:type IV pilus assembly protein PilC
VATFAYRALTPDGDERRGQIDAPGRPEALDAIKSRGELYVVELKPVAGGSAGGIALFSGVSKKELAMFFRQLAVLLKSGVSLLQSLSALRRQSRKRGLRNLLSRLIADVEEGMPLSEAMRTSGKFSSYDVGMVKAAEESGEMDSILDSVADQMEKNQELRSQIITSMIYPVMVSIMAIAVMLVLSVYVVPKFATILGAKGQSLPPVTQAMLTMSEWMQKWWKHLVGGLIGMAVGIPLLRKTPTGGYLVDWILLRVPVIGLVVQSGMVVGFARNLSILLHSGVVLSEAIVTVRGTLKNAVAARVLGRIHEAILSGEGMASTLRQEEGVFPPMVAEMVATGEETGEMVQVLELTARIYHKMLEAYVKRMVAVIEPLVIVVLGGMVGFVIMALMMGVMSMYGSMS